MVWVEDEPSPRVTERDTLGLNNLRPLEGDSAENRCCDSPGTIDEIEATEPVDALREPVKEIESRFDFRCKIPLEVGGTGAGG
jgi:hypothetical protein